MKIFIDESGVFSIPQSGHSVSLVGALVLPEISLNKIEKRYKRLRTSLPIDKGEVKGRLLAEGQVAAVVEILVRNEALYEASAITLFSGDENALRTHRQSQCEGFTNGLTPAHKPEMVEGVWGLRRTLEGISLPLYAQAITTFDTIWTTITHATAYFSQRRPESLAEFDWVVDAKAPEGVTKPEDWWRSVINPMLQNRSFRDPFPILEGGDYSKWPCKEMAIPAYLVSAIPELEGGTGINVNQAFKQIRFLSTSEYGLELVDIVTNAARRAILGNLQQTGWWQIPHLMIHRKDPYIHLMGLSERDASPGMRNVVKHFRNRGRTMIAPRYQNDKS